MVAACGGRGAIDPQAPIIVISIDTLRSDRLPAYGYSKIETPGIDQLNRDSIRFERAYSHTPLTLVSHASLFTGTLPAEHGIRDNLGYQLNPKSKTLAELLKTKGYATGGAVSAVVLRGETGIKRGFDFWDDDIDLDPTALSIARAQRGGDATREIAEKWIRQHKSQPFFFFLHLYEPHTPYDPVEPFRTRYGPTYDAEIASADAVVGRFISFLRDESLYDRATIILLSDHGEGLGDHGEDEHGILLYRETLQVPLLLKLPRERQKGTSVAAPVGLIDVFTTIAEAVGVRQKSEGRSLLDIANGKVTGDRPIYAETFYPRFHFGWSDLHSIVSGANHYIHAPKPELYDVVADPGETKNVLQDNRRAYTALREQIQPYIHAAAAPSAVDEEQRQQLAALGYIGSTVSSSPDAKLPDPKDNIGKIRDIGDVFRSYREQEFERTVALTSKLLADNPNMFDLWTMKARALGKLNRREEAIEAAKQGLRLDPSSSSLAVTVANLSLELERLDDAEKHARLVLKDLPSEAHQLLGQVALQRKDYATARAEAGTARDGRDRPGALMLLGRVALAEGKPEEALKQFDDALAQLQAGHRRALPKLNFFRGDALARLGRADEAEQSFRAEIAAFPDDATPYRNLILLYAVEGKNDAATQLIFSLEKAAPTPPSYVAIAETLKLIGDVRGARFWAARGLRRFPNDRQLQALLRG